MLTDCTNYAHFNHNNRNVETEAKPRRMSITESNSDNPLKQSYFNILVMGRQKTMPNKSWIGKQFAYSHYLVSCIIFSPTFYSLQSLHLRNTIFFSCFSLKKMLRQARLEELHVAPNVGGKMANRGCTT